MSVEKNRKFIPNPSVVEDSRKIHMRMLLVVERSRNEQ